MGFFGENNVNLAFFTENGRFLGRLQGRQSVFFLVDVLIYLVLIFSIQAVPRETCLFFMFFGWITLVWMIYVVFDRA